MTNVMTNVWCCTYPTICKFVMANVMTSVLSDVLFNRLWCYTSFSKLDVLFNRLWCSTSLSKLDVHGECCSYMKQEVGSINRSSIGSKW
jgi:hypothetical protein